jgi:hypothetical protein
VALGLLCRPRSGAAARVHPLLAGLLVGIINLRYATAGMTCFALLSILAMALGRETGYDELPR